MITEEKNFYGVTHNPHLPIKWTKEYLIEMIKYLRREVTLKLEAAKEREDKWGFLTMCERDASIKKLRARALCTAVDEKFMLEIYNETLCKMIEVLVLGDEILADEDEDTKER